MKYFIAKEDDKGTYHNMWYVYFESDSRHITRDGELRGVGERSVEDFYFSTLGEVEVALAAAQIKGVLR